MIPNNLNQIKQPKKRKTLPEYISVSTT
uniref:Uncharacterized protein n=1 Tax=Rhizophora mucronata TaxID=61149 RepID=A0A2P2R4T4_RHIMU